MLFLICSKLLSNDALLSELLSKTGPALHVVRGEVVGIGISQGAGIVLSGDDVANLVKAIVAIGRDKIGADIAEADQNPRIFKQIMPTYLSYK